MIGKMPICAPVHRSGSRQGPGRAQVSYGDGRIPGCSGMMVWLVFVAVAAMALASGYAVVRLRRHDIDPARNDERP
jgi:hypothetical protein